MTLAHRSSEASNNGSGGTTITMDKPSGVVDGDTMVMGVTSRGGTGVSISPPAAIESVSQGTNHGANVGKAHTSVYSPDSRYFWYCSAAGSVYRVCRVDCLTHTVTDVTVSDFYPVMLVMSEDGAFIYAITASALKIKVIDTATCTLLTSIDRSSYGAAADVILVGSNLYIANDSGATGSVDVWALTASTPWATFTANVALTGSDYDTSSIVSNGTYVYVGSIGSKVSVLQISDHSLVTVLDTGITHGTNIIMAVTPNGAKVYCAGTSGDLSAATLAIINTSTNTVSGTHPTVGATGVGGLVVTADGLYVYATNKNDNNVTCVTVSTDTVRGTISMGSYVEYNPQSSPDGQHVWFVLYLNGAGCTIKRVRVSDNTVIDTLAANDKTRSMLMSPDGRFIWAYQSWSTSFNKISTWGPLGAPIAISTTLRQQIFWKVAAGEGSSYSVKLSASNLASGVIVAVDATVVAFETVQYAGQDNVSGTNVVAPALGSWSSADGVDIGIFGTAYGTTFTPPTNYIEPATADDKSTGTTSATASEGSYRALTGVTTVGSITATAANAAVNIGHHIFVSQNLLINRFSMVVDPTSTSIARGGSDATLDLDTTLTAGNAEDITLDATGEPSGLTVSFNPNPVTAGSTSDMNVEVGGSVTEGTHVITVTGTSESDYEETTFSVSVYASPAPIAVHLLGSTL